MNKPLVKWIILLAAGLLALIFTVFCYLQKNYTWVMAGLFIGLFLTITSIKRIKFLKNGERAVREGREKITIQYRDKNLKESETAVVPAGADGMYFYGYLPDEKVIKVFRWDLIRRAAENGKNIQKEDILERVYGQRA